LAAITPFVESEEAPEDPSAEVQGEGLGGFGAVDVKNLLEQSHAGLTRFVWNRTLIEDHLRTCHYWIEDDAQYGLVIRIDKPLPKDLRPWKLTEGGPDAQLDRFALFSVGNKKMSTMSWDIPSGPPGVGGACPGAVAAQTIVPPETRAALLSKDRTHLRVTPPGYDRPVEFKEAQTICAYCYAGEGNFDYAGVQTGLTVRYWWTKDALSTPEGRAAWITTMAEGVLRSPFPLQEDKYSGRMTRPVRVHSSGDFFSPAYAEAWMEVANLVGGADKDVVFWAPTRTWASPGFLAKWPAILAKNTAKNFIVRPSAYHVGDFAPGPLAPGNAKGSTSLIHPPEPGKESSNFQRVFHDAVQDGQPGPNNTDPRRDFDCPAYTEEGGSCVTSRCRVCWTMPERSVNYPFH